MRAGAVIMIGRSGHMVCRYHFHVPSGVLIALEPPNLGKSMNNDGYRALWWKHQGESLLVLLSYSSTHLRDQTIFPSIIFSANWKFSKPCMLGKFNVFVRIPANYQADVPEPLQGVPRCLVLRQIRWDFFENLPWIWWKFVNPKVDQTKRFKVKWTGVFFQWNSVSLENPYW